MDANWDIESSKHWKVYFQKELETDLESTHLLLGREYSNIKQGRVTQPHAIWHTYIWQRHIWHTLHKHTHSQTVDQDNGLCTLDSLLEHLILKFCTSVSGISRLYQTLVKIFTFPCNDFKQFIRYIHDTQAKTCLAQHYANVVLRASEQTSVSWRYKMGAGLVQNGRGWSVTSQFTICQDFRSEWIPNWWRRLRLSGKSLTTTASNSQLRGKTPSIKERWKLFLPASSSILPSLVDRGEHFIISINPANYYYWIRHSHSQL